MKKRLEELRSQRWFGTSDLRAFGHRSRALQMGYAREDFMNKPVVGIINTWSDLAQCHSHFPERVQDIKRGIWQAGGFPVELPAMSLSEQYVKPSSMKEPRYGDRFVQMRKDFFKNGNYPGSALITVTNFARPGIEIEIQAVGVIGDNCSSENPCSAEGKAKKSQAR